MTVVKEALSKELLSRAMRKSRDADIDSGRVVDPWTSDAPWTHPRISAIIDRGLQGGVLGEPDSKFYPLKKKVNLYDALKAEFGEARKHDYAGKDFSGKVRRAVETANKMPTLEEKIFRDKLKVRLGLGGLGLLGLGIGGYALYRHKKNQNKEQEKSAFDQGYGLTEECGKMEKTSAVKAYLDFMQKTAVSPEMAMRALEKGMKRTGQGAQGDVLAALAERIGKVPRTISRAAQHPGMARDLALHGINDPASRREFLSRLFQSRDYVSSMRGFR